ncbi:MAG: hypothetical protein LBT97_11955 [Planctomycetota bacterium]|jgi:DNA-binding transcriptional regulator LsrR (DeoR family)|nr:hypothetical protein [Planctomycetota bacterium]
MPQDNLHELLLRIAWLYYVDEMNQQEIADRLELPRIKVLRLLKEAKARGMVDVRVKGDRVSLFSLEHELVDLTGLDEVTVVPSGPDPVRSVAYGLTYRFIRALRTQRVIGIGIGRTLHQFAQLLDVDGPIKTEDVVSLVGNTQSNMALDLLDMSYTLATKLKVNYFNLWAPAWGATPQEAESIMRNPSIAGTLRRAENADIAFIGIGAMKNSMYVRHGYITPEILRGMRENGFVGEVLGQFYSLQGELLPHKVQGCFIAVDMPLRCPVVAVCAGAEKRDAFIGAWRAGFVNELVTDEDLARSLAAALKRERRSVSRAGGRIAT